MKFNEVEKKKKCGLKWRTLFMWICIFYEIYIKEDAETYSLLCMPLKNGGNYWPFKYMFLIVFN